ncbi:MAG: hypothetical protein IPM79_31670 [Polyangiaceae bacterium]|nr:hypothetical protein [Polyangiaceae bacterium]
MGDPEVGHDHPPAPRDHDVVGLDVSVDDPDGVRSGERIGDTDADARCGSDVEGPPAFEDAPDRLSVYELHGQEARPAGLAELEGAGDVAMGHATREANLVSKTIETA